MVMDHHHHRFVFYLKVNYKSYMTITDGYYLIKYKFNINELITRVVLHYIKILHVYY